MAISKVFIIQEGQRYDTSNAARHGAVTYLATPFINPEAYVGAIIESLEANGYDPEIDYIALTGPANKLFLLGFGLSEQWGYIKILMWNTTTERYVPYEIGQREIA